jgi:hypothetical protein
MTRLLALPNRGTLLLDTLIALIIFAVVFSSSFLNYEYTQAFGAVSADAQNMTAIAQGATLYLNDNGSPPPAGAVSTSNPGPTYLAVVPSSKIGPNGFSFGSNPPAGASYVIVDQTPLQNNIYGFYKSLYSAYTQIDGKTACTSNNYLALAQGRIYCAASAQG